MFLSGRPKVADRLLYGSGIGDHRRLQKAWGPSPETSGDAGPGLGPVNRLGVSCDRHSGQSNPAGYVSDSLRGKPRAV
eukprot:7473932-Pyramimonas_sp.AAC.1